MCFPIWFERWGEVVVHYSNQQEKVLSDLRNCSLEELRVITLRSALRVMPLSSIPRFHATRPIEKAIEEYFRAILFCWVVQDFLFNKGGKFLDDVYNRIVTYGGFEAEAAIKAAVVAIRGGADDAMEGLRHAAQNAAWLTDARTRLGAATAAGLFHPMLPKGRDLDLAEKSKARIDTGNSIWQAICADLIAIKSGPAGKCLYTPVWQGVGCPQYFDGLDEEFKRCLGSLGRHWFLVYDFYQALRDGYPPFANLGSKAEEVLLALAKEGRDFWEREPDEVMFDLADRLDYNAEPPVNHGEIAKVLENLTQVAADFRFAENEKGAIDAVPFSALARDPGFAGTTLSEARGKAQELADRLKRANAPGRVMRSVTRLLDALPEQLGDLNPALLRSRSRSLEADAIAYGAAGAEAELFPDAVSELLDVVGTLNDLQGCFPAIAEVERNIAAIDIAGREDKVQPELSVISASARELSAQYPHVMTEAAAEAVAALDADIADAADIEVKRDLLARSLLIKRNFLSAVYRKVLSPAGREALRVGKLHYDGAISGSVEGVKKLAAFVPTALLIMYLTGPMGAKMSILAEQFKILKDAKYIVDRLIFDRQKSDNGQD